MATHPANLNMVPVPTAASAGASTSIHVHQFNGLSKPTLVFSHNLGPEHPAILSFTIQGICRELSFWFKHFSNHCLVDFAPMRFDSPPSLTNAPNINPWSHPYGIRRYDTLSFCSECVRLLSRRTCDGRTVMSYQGCDFHRKHVDVPFAYRRRDIHTPQTSFIREAKHVFWNPKSRVTMFYLSKNPFPMLEPSMSVSSNGTVVPASQQNETIQNTGTATEAKAVADKANPVRHGSVSRPQLVSLEHVPFLHHFRKISERASLPRVEYLHTETCIHGSKPDCIVQGPGLAGLYYKRCDGRFVNALGHVLDVPPAGGASSSVNTTTILTPTLPPLTTDLQHTSAEIAEQAWRRHHPTAGPDSWSEVKALKKREETEAAAARRAEKLATIVPRAGDWVRQRGRAARARKDRVKSRVGAWCLEHTGFWGA